MCLIYGLKIWWKYGGKLILVLHPAPHVLVCCKDGIIRHGTKKGTGKWHIEQMQTNRFIRWFLNANDNAKEDPK
jgi:hypothetical protein